MVDKSGQVWLLEVNVTPSMHAASPLDQRVKNGVADSLLRILFGDGDTGHFESLSFAESDV